MNLNVAEVQNNIVFRHVGYVSHTVAYTFRVQNLGLCPKVGGSGLGAGLAHAARQAPRNGFDVIDAVYNARVDQAGA